MSGCNDLMLSFKLYPHEVKEQHVRVKYKSVSQAAAADLSPLMLFWPVFVVMCRFDKSYVHDDKSSQNNSESKA